MNAGLQINEILVPQIIEKTPTINKMVDELFTVIVKEDNTGDQKAQNINLR